jgi:hypothetical protein
MEGNSMAGHPIVASHSGGSCIVPDSLEKLKVRGERSMTQNVAEEQLSTNANLDCEVAMGFCIFDAVCLCVGAVGLRASVQRAVIESVAEAARPALSEVERIIAQMASKETTITQTAYGVYKILTAIYRAQCLGAVVAAFRNTLTWWNAVLYGVSATATIIAVLATDGAAFVAEVVVVLATFGFLASDIERAVRVCNLSVSHFNHPLPPKNKPVPSGSKVIIRTRNGHPIMAVNNGGLDVGTVFQTNRTQIGPWEKYTLVPIDPDKQTFALQTVNGPFVTAEGGGGKNSSQASVVTGGPIIGPWERLILQHLHDGTYAICTTDGYYITAINGGGVGDPRGDLPLRTDATGIGPDETFTFG